MTELLSFFHESFTTEFEKNSCEIFDTSKTVVVSPASIFIHSADSTDVSCGSNDGKININASFEDENCECKGDDLVSYTVLYTGSNNVTINIKNDILIIKKQK